MLEETCALISSNVQPFLSKYLWQKDKFNLSVVYDKKKGKYLSAHISEAVIAVSDNDGDVLLIEAAMELPSWLDPSNSENRIYIHNGKVYIIPLPSTPADIMQIPSAGKLDRERAVQLVRKRPDMVANAGIQNAILDRLSGYPEAAKTELHGAKCTLPKQAAFVLLREPQLLPLAIEAFYLRDPMSLKACAAMQRFSPANNNVVSTTIQFTRTTYAQTVSQKFYPPKPFNLPPVSRKKEHQAAELGMKLACGMEMLYADDRLQQPEEEAAEDVRTYRFTQDPKWREFSNNVTRLGYFRGEKEGSRLYNELELKAKEQYLLQRRERLYVHTEDVDVDDMSILYRSSSINMNARKKIDTILAEYSEETLQEALDNNQIVEGSDDWMQVDAQQLEEMLTKRLGNMKDDVVADMEKEMKDETEPAVDLEKIISSFEHFVEGSQSGIDGVEFPGGNTGDDSEYDEEDEMEDEDQAISFDMERFMNILKGSLDIPEAQMQHTQPSTKDKSTEQVDNLSNLMQQMDQEVYGHDKIGKSFAKATENEDEDEEDESAPVDVQLNLVKNVLESFKSQQGLPGPAGNILSQFGVALPTDNEE
ncbi:hypothetical protein DFQ29_005886 [Apophysomyces sp. BC1021]|nr:hypothetical protein DFQ29_005886 [Apophysomyces sp. BC1021]